MTVLPRDGAWTFADLDALPADGLRYELVDGVLLVSPAPSRLHQRAVTQLVGQLLRACPHDLEVLVAPTDYRPTSSRSLQPDVLVLSRADPGTAALTFPLALAVEVLSPSSRSVDLVLKRALYEQAGVAHYWVVDPAGPSLQAWRLVAGAYVSEDLVVDGVLTALEPVPLRVALTDLLA